MADDGVRLVKPGMKYEGAQGVTYDAGHPGHLHLIVRQ